MVSRPYIVDVQIWSVWPDFLWAEMPKRAIWGLWVEGIWWFQRGVPEVMEILGRVLTVPSWYPKIWNRVTEQCWTSSARTSRNPTKMNGVLKKIVEATGDWRFSEQNGREKKYVRDIVAWEQYVTKIYFWLWHSLTHYNAFNSKWVWQHILTITKIFVTGVTLPLQLLLQLWHSPF